VIMDKKVTIKYFLNEDLSPAVYYTEEGIELNLFPLYVRVTYNRQSTRFKFSPSIHIEQNADIEEFFKERKIEFLLTEKEEIIERLIRYEANSYGEKFTLKGLGNRLLFYETSVIDFLLNIGEDFERLDELVKESKFDYLIGKPSNNPYVKLGIAYLTLGKEPLINNFSSILEKMITASITYYVKVKMNVFDWLIRNNKNDVIQYARTGFLNKIDSISNSDLDTKELLLQEIPDKYRHLIDENDEEFNMSLRVIKLLSEVQFTVKGENIDFIIKDTDENLKKIQNQLYDKMFK